MSSFGIYVHVPYCIQRCSYCDFATYEQSKIMPPAEYFQLLYREIQAYSALAPVKGLDTIYFGGGTPSLVDPKLIISVMNEFSKQGFVRKEDCEVTIEINPATISEEKMTQYLEAGVNRFSVGAQTFDDDLLRKVNREHNAQATRDTLELLKKFNTNFTFDILFALPGQTMEGVNRDIDITLSYEPNHISAYCLTVPDGHPLAKARLPEDTQVSMFEQIGNRLEGAGLKRYEISNFARAGFESRHNILYWSDQSYWGVGLGAHSYIREEGPWGLRFWNPNNINEYTDQWSKEAHPRRSKWSEGRSPKQFEFLEENESLTDFCHTSMRMMSGMSMAALSKKFGQERMYQVNYLCSELEERGLVSLEGDKWRLTSQGILLSNQVFSKLAFLD